MVDHLGGDEARGDGVDRQADRVVGQLALLGQQEGSLLRQCLGQPEQPRLSGRVVRRPILPVSPTIDETLMIRRVPRSSMWASAA